MVIRLIVAALAGFGAHKLYKPTLDFSERWGEMLRYAIGGLLLIPIRLLFYGGLKNIPSHRERSILADVLALFGVGAGVLAGHLWDKVGKK